MSDVRELLARLNQSSVRFDIGSGGIPELTPQDIAAALAFIPSKLGREVLCAIWWQDGADYQKLDKLLSEAQYQEHSLRVETWRKAKLEHMIGQDEASATRRNQHEIARTLVQLEINEENARSRIWGDKPALFRAIRSAVVAEMRSPRHCTKCSGRGAVRSENLVVVCPGCEGIGKVAVSDRQRAESIGRDESSYRRNGWKDLFEWTYRQAYSAEQEAARSLFGALRKD